MMKSRNVYLNVKKSITNKNNVNSVLPEFSPTVNLSVKNTRVGGSGEENVHFTFRDVKYFILACADCPSNLAPETR